ncbi:MAG: hypothetical protein UY93_C0007G0004 [Parcubacteria group bacterium GW2011_GWA1_56_13]|nr:MAG: hypothetical protein UY93_C0007G0004 [Parcubacteria group bacterium GW2011_GWA1_56_13]
MDILKNKFVIGGIGAVLLLTLVYYVWTSAENGALLTTNDGTSPLSQEILLTLGQLHTIRLDPAIFTDPVFASLTDFGVTIPPQQAGRRNPFAPVGK